MLPVGLLLLVSQVDIGHLYVWLDILAIPQCHLTMSGTACLFHDVLRHFVKLADCCFMLIHYLRVYIYIYMCVFFVSYLYYIDTYGKLNKNVEALDSCFF